MHGLTTLMYKDSYAVSADGKILIYGLTQKEASEFCKMHIMDHNTRIPGGRSNIEFLPTAKSEQARRGRKLILAPFTDLIKSYLEESQSPTIAELDQLLKAAGAAYSNTSAINNMLQSLGFNIQSGRAFRRGAEMGSERMVVDERRRA